VLHPTNNWRLRQTFMVYSRYIQRTNCLLVCHSHRFLSLWGIMVFNTAFKNIYVVFLFCFSSYCVPYVANFSGLSIFFISPSVFSNVYLLGLAVLPMPNVFQIFDSTKHIIMSRAKTCSIYLNSRWWSTRQNILYILSVNRKLVVGMRMHRLEIHWYVLSDI
jgi:hypothetical protein